jgi:hypothetical protein
MTDPELKPDPLISVITAVYDGEAFVASTIESVLSQTYPSWELIVVDDGSTDSTPAVVGQFSDPRIRCIRQENRGLSAARNAGIRAAQGKYLSFLDADDEWYPSFLEHCVTALENNRDPRIVGAYTSHVYIDEDGTLLPQPGSGIVPPEELPSRLVAENFFPPCVVMIQAEAVREVGLFDEALRSTEDKDMWFRVTRRYTLLGIPEPLARYRVYPGSMSTNAARMHENRMAVLRKGFGPDEGDPAQWSQDKRLAFSRGYRRSACERMEQGDVDTGWNFLFRGVEISPDMLSEVQTYYELVCLRQPRGYRGQEGNLDLVDIGEEILTVVQAHLDRSGAPLIRLRRIARATACLAIAQLAEHGGDWGLARRYMWQAFVASPRSLASTGSMRRVLKLALGKRCSAVVRSWIR